MNSAFVVLKYLIISGNPGILRSGYKVDVSKIIAIGSMKGGVGKTTTAVNLAQEIDGKAHLTVRYRYLPPFLSI